jgi:tRNA dimethylallyltransferase
MNKPHIIVVAGPTASGKSDFAVELALTCKGEIISADSRQVYKGLDIGTGKITEEEMKGIPHHMLSVYNLGDEVSVIKYKEDGEKAIEDILSRGKTPIICGGTGQYIDALIYDIPLPPVPPNETLRKELETYSTEDLAERLREADETRYQAIDNHNRVRIIRALEIIDTLGKVPPLTASSSRYDMDFYLLNPSREILRERVVRRIAKRMNQGMIEETKELIIEGRTREEELKRYGIEYYVIAKYINGELSEKEMIEILTNKIMQYAKRQQTWNKKYLPFAKLIEVQ